MYGMRVNPARVQAGDSIATKFDPDTMQVRKTRTVKRVGFCPGKPENVHLDHECYDTRFSTIVVPIK